MADAAVSPFPPRPPRPHFFFLKVNVRVAELRLADNGIGPEGALALTDVLKDNVSLKVGAY